MNEKCLILLSAGLDSSVNLLLAQEKYEVALTLTFNYGQRAAAKELEHAQKLSAHYKIPNQVINLDLFSRHSGSALFQKEINHSRVPSGAEIDITSLEKSYQSAKAVWVPNRNGVFMNVAAMIAEAKAIPVIVPGFNAEEAATFPDNSKEFILALNGSLRFSTMGKVRAECPTVAMSKTEIVKAAKARNFDFGLIWPCYHSGKKWCGQCESCLRSRRALEQNGIKTEEYVE